MKVSLNDLTPETVWRCSPIKQDAVDRILKAAGIPLDGEEEDTEALQLTLAFIAYSSVSFALGARQATKAEREKVAVAFRHLIRAIESIRFTAQASPEVPTDWGINMVEWIREKIVENPSAASRPPKTDNTLIYPQLLSYYCIAFNKHPTTGDTGPTARFLKTFFQEMKTGLEAVSWTLKEVPAYIKRPQLQSLFEVPPPTTLRSKIRQNLASGTSKESVLTVDAVFQFFQIELAKKAEANTR